MDAYSILDLASEQVSYLNDFDRLCPTTDYNVTFERVTRVAYADRSHHFISGTASIDRARSCICAIRPITRAPRKILRRGVSAGVARRDRRRRRHRQR